jgi:hypothetical protein
MCVSSNHVSLPATVRQQICQICNLLLALLTKESTIQALIKMHLRPVPPPVNFIAPRNVHSNIFNIKILQKIHTMYACLFQLILHT